MEQCEQLKAESEALSSDHSSTDTITSDQQNSDSEEVEKYVKLTETLRWVW